MKKKLELFLEEWKRSDGRPDSYIIEKEIKNATGEQTYIHFLDALHDFLSHQTNTNFNISFIGDFDSPGYSLECYALAIEIEHKIEIYPINIEFF